MQRSSSLSSEDLEAWRVHPVSLEIKAALRASLEHQREAATEAWWAGRAWSEADRLALLRTETLFEDIFEASANDFNRALMKDENE